MINEVWQIKQLVTQNTIEYYKGIKTMSFHSFTFLFFLGAVLLVYYVLPGVCRRWVLLGANILFYLYVGWEKLAFLIATSIVVYSCTVFMGKQYEKMQRQIEEEKLKGKEKTLIQTMYKKKCKKPLVVSIVLIIGVLAYCKYTGMLIGLWNQLQNLRGNHTIDTLKIIVPMGISYYTFSSVGYLLDIYWRKKSYEKSYIDLFVSMSFFPQMVQGPIARYPKLIQQVKELKGFEYERFCMAFQLMLWGYFKKMVIADRIAIFVSEVFGNIGYYRGLVFVVALAASAVQLYADFSGCMDIVEGIAELFGIRLDKNFDLPFSSQSTAEFWRRWHITLGAWFKDYIFFPMSTSGWNIKISRFFKTKFGTRAGKTVTSIIPLAVVWLLTGIWHGTGMNYVVWGCYYGIIIIISSIFQPELKQLTELLHINTETISWKYFCRFRIFVIFCGGRLLTVPGSLGNTGLVIKNMLAQWNPWIFFDGTMFGFGLNAPNVWVLLLGIAVLGFVGHLHAKGVKIRESIAAQHIAVRWLIYLTAIFAVLILGMYGANYHGSEFIYAGY